MRDSVGLICASSGGLYGTGTSKVENPPDAGFQFIEAAFGDRAAISAPTPQL